MASNDPKPKNPFQELANSHQPPDDLKDKVMSSAKISYTIISTLDLFIIKPMALVVNLFITEE